MCRSSADIRRSLKFYSEAKTVVFFATGTKTLAIIAITDKVKETSKTAISQLQNKGIEVYMLTGDNQHTAQAISTQVGIKSFKSGMMPSEKADFGEKTFRSREK